MGADPVTLDDDGFAAGVTPADLEQGEARIAFVEGQFDGLFQTLGRDAAHGVADPAAMLVGDRRGLPLNEGETVDDLAALEGEGFGGRKVGQRQRLAREPGDQAAAQRGIELDGEDRIAGLRHGRGGWGAAGKGDGRHSRAAEKRQNAAPIHQRFGDHSQPPVRLNLILHSRILEGKQKVI
ncbi:hypothetical protein ACRAWD_10555 [Caulobacter segnis]